MGGRATGRSRREGAWSQARAEARAALFPGWSVSHASCRCPNVLLAPRFRLAVPAPPRGLRARPSAPLRAAFVTLSPTLLQRWPTLPGGRQTACRVRRRPPRWLASCPGAGTWMVFRLQAAQCPPGQRDVLKPCGVNRVTTGDPDRRTFSRDAARSIKEGGSVREACPDLCPRGHRGTFSA